MPAPKIGLIRYWQANSGPGAASSSYVFLIRWPLHREAQTLALQLPNTAQAVLIDLGEATDIHPRNKRDVGERLAKTALARDYGRDIPWSGPLFQSATVEEGKIRIAFTHTDGGLVARELPATYVLNSTLSQCAPLTRNSPGSQLEGFAICGADRQWVWAEAEIEGETVAVWSHQIAAPIAVRYAWADNPTCNLYNGADLPASPFRTDDFPLSTATGNQGPLYQPAQTPGRPIR